MSNVENLPVAAKHNVGQIEAELVALTVAADRLDGVVTDLEQRLSSVLAAVAPAPPQGANSGATPEPLRVPLADSMWQQRVRLDVSVRHIQYLLDRIEL